MLASFWSDDTTWLQPCQAMALGTESDMYDVCQVRALPLSALAKRLMHACMGKSHSQQLKSLRHVGDDLDVGDNCRRKGKTSYGQQIWGCGTICDGQIIASTF